MVATAGMDGSALPVRLRNGSFLLVRWGAQGRRFDSMKRAEQIRWPDGAWLGLQDIKGGMLAYGGPRPVRIVAKRFMVTVGLEGGGELDRWFDLKPGQFLQGCYFRNE